MKKKLLIIIPVILVLSLALVYFLVIKPNNSYNKDKNIIKNKISMVNDYIIDNTGDINTIINELKKESVSSERLEIEKLTNNYLNSIIENTKDYEEIRFDKINYLFNDSNIKENIDDNVKLLNEEKEKMTVLNSAVNELKEIDIDSIKNDDNKKLLQELFSDFSIDSLKKKIDDTSKYIDYNITLFDSLKKNKDNWNYEDGKIVFTKRSAYVEYDKLSNGQEYKLIDDKTGPVITASDITITKGNSLNIKDKVSCNDAVDGKVECKIEGSYDTKKTGTYNIKISANDKSKNVTTKNIKVTVKEKEVVKNTKPYYIEVIRNHNVVVVYGLDSNNKYTKIVKVFICSVGKSGSETPTGTFTTSDKSSWGWLVGNLYGQYYTRIVGSILFHSVPYTKKAKNTLEWDEYNKLGSPASKGCVRMTVRDVKWIYDNCPRGTTVKIYDGNLPSGVTKPTAQKISGDSPNKGWDPTDPDKNNPWKK